MAKICNPSVILLSLLVVLPFTALLAQDQYTDGKPKIACWIFKNDHKPIVIVVHGGPGADHNYLLPEWKELSVFVTLVFYDQRGSGKSEHAACNSWREHVNDLSAVIQIVSPHEKVFLAGTSWGVDLSLLFTHYHPDKVKGLILSGITAWKGQGFPQQDCKQYAYAEDIEIKRSIEQSLSDYKNMVPAFQTNTANRENSIMNKKEIHDNETIKIETLKSLKDAPSFDELIIQPPSLILQGTESCSFPDLSIQFSKKINSVEVVRIDNACHDPWAVNPTAFFSACGKFISANH